MISFFTTSSFEMDYVEYASEESSIIQRPVRNLSNPLQCFEDFEFRDRFRLQKISVINLTEILDSDLSRGCSNRGCPPPAVLQVMVALRFYADGCAHRTTADLFDISQANVCRIVHRVSKVICLHRAEFIKFPDDRQCESIKHIYVFFTKFNFPGKWISELNNIFNILNTLLRFLRHFRDSW